MRAYSKGSVSLSSAFGIFAAMLFALCFSNITRYVTSKAAVEATVREVTRCLSPTDADCRMSEVSVAPDVEYEDWYQQNFTRTETVSYKTFKYSASLKQENFQASYPTYLTHIIQPSVSWSTYKVPRKQFSVDLNEHETVYARIKGCGGKRMDFYQEGVIDPSRYVPAIPHWDTSEELKQLSSNDYSPYCMARATEKGLECCADPRRSECTQKKYISPPGRKIFFKRFDKEVGAGRAAVGSTIFLSSDHIQVPAGPLNVVPWQNCDAGGGVSCQESLSGISNAAKGAWFNTAHVAFRVTAEVCASHGRSIEVAWSNSELGSDKGSIRMNVSGEDSSRHYGRGVVEWRKVSRGTCQWYGTTLRGSFSNSSHQSTGQRAYDPISVAWGSTLSLTGALRVQGGVATVHRVRYDVYMTNYGGGGWRKHCAECDAPFLQLNDRAGLTEGPGGLAMCNPREFPPSDNWQWHPDGKRYFPYDHRLEKDGGDIVRVAPSCRAGDNTFPISMRTGSGNSSTCSVLANVCSESWRPRVDPKSVCGSSPSNRSYCSWDFGTLKGYNEVTKVPSSCKATEIRHNSTFPPTMWDVNLKDKLDPLHQEIRDANLKTAQVNQSQAKGISAPIFKTYKRWELDLVQNEMPGLSLHPAHPKELRQTAQRFEFAWNKTGKVSDCSSCSQHSGTCPVQACKVNNTFSISAFKKKGQDSLPEISMISLEAPQNNNRLRQASRTKPASQIQELEIEKTDSSEISLDYLPLFDGREKFEIPVLGKAGCNMKCANPDAKDVYNKETLNEVLKAYSEKYAKTEHSKIILDGAEISIKVEELSKKTGARPDDMPACTPTETTSECHPSPAKFLTRVLNSSSSEIPKQCLLSTAHKCTSGKTRKYTCESDVSFNQKHHGGCSSVLISLKETADSGIETETQSMPELHQAALKKAYAEMKRYSPTVSYGCASGESNCFEMSIDESDPVLSRVKLSYKMPLTFPFDHFAGKDFVNIQDSKLEPREIDLISE